LCQISAVSNVFNCEKHQNSTELDAKFLSHVSEYGLSFGTKEEYEFRKSLFIQADKELEEIRQEGGTYEVEHNMFSTMTKDEMKRFMGRVPQQNSEEIGEVEYLDESNLEANVDWRSKGAVNPVQNQGNCGSCWAFSTTAAVEGAHKIHSGKLLKLAESQLVDCDRNDGGCNGGLETQAMKYLESHPQELEKDYPYVPKTRRCSAKSGKGIVKVTSISKVPKKSVSQLKAAVSKQPTCIAVGAGDRHFNSYKSGILNTTQCGT